MLVREEIEYFEDFQNRTNCTGLSMQSQVSINDCAVALHRYKTDDRRPTFLETFSFIEQLKYRTCTPFLANGNFWRLLREVINIIGLNSNSSSCLRPCRNTRT